VGLCQWGAKQRALDGFGYDEILSYYYPGTDLIKLSDIR
jgi:stage II sporulation protein D